MSGSGKNAHGGFPAHTIHLTLAFLSDWRLQDDHQ
jgi:hypothetical protein